MERNNQDVTSLFTLYPQNAVVKTDIYISTALIQCGKENFKIVCSLSYTL